MDDEVEDLVGDVKYTDSQKSVTTSAVYSLDFTDSSSDKNNSSSKETYVIDHDSDDSDKTFQLCEDESMINLMDNKTLNMRKNRNEHNYTMPTIDRAVSTSLHKCNIVAEETFTQTSRTIFEIAQNDSTNKHTESLETQTSFMSITEKKSVEYRIHILGANYNNEFNDLQFMDETIPKENDYVHDLARSIMVPNNSKSILDSSNVENDEDTNSDNYIIRFIEDDSQEDINTALNNETQYTTSEFESSFDSEIENDSLMENKQCDEKCKDSDYDNETSEVINSIDNDVKELYNRLSDSPQLLSPILLEPVKKFGILTPLTEETVPKNDSIIDVTPSARTLTEASEDTLKHSLFVNTSGVTIKVLSDNDDKQEYRKLKLPPIVKTQSWPCSPNLNFLFTINSQKSVEGSDTLPYLYDRQSNKFFDRWETDTKELAAGESPLITGRSDSVKTSKNRIHLPPIHIDCFHNTVHNDPQNEEHILPSNIPQTPIRSQFDEISINGKIKELKMNARKTGPKSSSRSPSPTSICSPDESRTCDTHTAERGCDILCTELLRRLRSTSWVEITETLEDLPKALEKFWSVITELRIADLLRQVSGHVESPRTQVARAACKTLAEILKNTNYTKKPDFYESISTLLTKTGSFNRPVRREANIALDDIVCTVDVTHCVTAICVYGVSHKSALVRCASARLLVVCCALAEGGRQILRNRPPTAAAARLHALRSLAELLQDKSTETRKYAERLYAMLRPLPNFEAYFLTDVDVELASKHMKKYDQLLFNTKAR